MSSAAMVTCGKPPQKPKKNKFQSAYDLFKAIEKIVEKADIAAANEPFEFNPEHELKRSDFTRIRHNPDTDLSRDFIFGVASAAYQYEGATKTGGRGPSIWDTISENPGRIADSSNGNTAVNSYHQFQEDVKLLKALGVDYYRFSISWSRILPSGKLSGGINKEGVDYYNNLIDELLANGINPSVTLFHFDLPQALEDHYGGFLDERIVDDFREYARVCFWEFGDRVKHWATVNEPYSYCFLGYATGLLAPFRGCPKNKEEVDLSKYSDREIGEMIREVFHHAQSKEDESNLSGGINLLEGLTNGTGDTVNGINEVARGISEGSKNVEETVHKWVKHLFGKDRSCKDHPSSRCAPSQSTLSHSQTIEYCEDPGSEPYKAAHNMLLAHAAAVHEYRTHFQTCQHGKIGLTMLSNWYKPLRGEQDKEIRDRALDFFIGWFLHPLKDGYYPKSMRDIVKDRLPEFTEEQRTLLIGSYDYIGVQYYTTEYATKGDPEPNGIPHCKYDPGVKFQAFDLNDVPIGPRCGSEWLHFYPQGIRKVLKYIKDNYNDPVIYITENGVSELNDLTLPVHKALQDQNRIIYHKEHLYYVRQAMIKDNVNVQGYFAWSFLDNFEWAAGYTVRFGMVYVDYRDECRRYPKMSACWYKNFLRQKIDSSKMFRSLESGQQMEVEDVEEEEPTSQTSNAYANSTRKIWKRPSLTQHTPNESKKNRISSLRM